MTFDVEEFDLPLEYNQQISLQEQLVTGYNGLQRIEDILNSAAASTTLFTTAVFAENFPNDIRELSEKHEIASHCFSHSTFEEKDLQRSKEKLESITGKKITGLRMPRMRKVEPGLVREAGYAYNSSINPTWLPGRYNNLKVPRLPFKENNLLQFPVSVSPHLRIPLFWLAFKNMPYHLYLRIVLQTLKHDGYVCLYFHPWEFIDLSVYKIPSYIKKGSKNKLLIKMKRLVADLSNEGEFVTMEKYISDNTLTT